MRLSAAARGLTRIPERPCFLFVFVFVSKQFALRPQGRDGLLGTGTGTGRGEGGKGAKE